MTPELGSRIQPLFKKLEEAILSQTYRVTSYALSDLSVDAMQKIQSALETILVELILIEDTEIQTLILDALSYICTDSSEAFLIDWHYTSLRQNKRSLYSVENFFVNLYKIREVDLYAAAQRHSNTYVRLFLIYESRYLIKNISLDEIEGFLVDKQKEVRHQALKLLTERPEKRFVPIYLRLLKDDAVYDFWGGICEALIEFGIPDDAFDVLLKSYLIAIERDDIYDLDNIAGTILKTLLACNRDLMVDTFLKLLKSSEQTLKWKAITAFEYIGPKDLKAELLPQLDFIFSKQYSETSEVEPVFELQDYVSDFKGFLELIEQNEAWICPLLTENCIDAAQLLHLVLPEISTLNMSSIRIISDIIFNYCLNQENQQYCLIYAPQIKEKLAPFLTLKDAETLFDLIGIFATLQTPDDISLFRELLNNENPEIRRHTLYHLRKCTYSEVKALFHLGFKDSSADVRREAILGMLENQDSFLNKHFRHVLSEPSYRVKILGLKYVSEHRPRQNIQWVVDSLFDAYSESVFEQKNHQDRSVSQLNDSYEHYLACVMDFLFELKVGSHPNSKVSIEIDQIYLSIFERLPRYFQIRMVTHMYPFLLDQVMDFIIQETRHMNKFDRHYEQFIKIVSSHFGDARMNDLLVYLDTQNYRLMGLALLALCKISSQALHFAEILT